MIILQRLYPFNIPTQDLIIIYVLYIRSLLEQNVAVWSSSITQEDVSDIERVQKVALKIILKSSYENYEQALKATGLQYLSDRRSILCLRFAKKCLRNEKTRDMFPLNPNFDKRLRHSEKYQVKFAHNDRLKFSAVPSLQRMLNEEHKLKQRASRTWFTVSQYLIFIVSNELLPFGEFFSNRYIISKINSLSLSKYCFSKDMLSMVDH